MKLQTYLINLDRAKERLVLMENEFLKSEISFIRISAVDARNLDKKTYNISNKYDRNLVPGEIGCYLSHIRALEKFLNSENEFALIIEDDAILSDNFKETIEIAISNYTKLAIKHQWDVLKLFNGKRRNIKIEKLSNSHFIGACGTSIPITTIAAIWTRNAAQKFLSKVKKNEIPIIQRPIDCDLQHPWEFDLNIYNLLPSLVKPAPVETQIQIDRSLKKSKFPRQLIYEVKRFFPKYYYLIDKHGFIKFYNSFIAKKFEKIS